MTTCWLDEVDPEIAAYWDKIATQALKTELQDNIWKRRVLLPKVLAQTQIGESVVEIGMGAGLIAATVNLIMLGHVGYVGTDMSPKFCEYGAKRWKLNTVQCAITTIPVKDQQASMIWAFDTLEHVEPSQRERGYRELSRIMQPSAKILLNVPLDASYHDPKFDFEFDERDLGQLAHVTGTRLIHLERYVVPEIDRSYQFVVLAR